MVGLPVAFAGAKTVANAYGQFLFTCYITSKHLQRNELDILKYQFAKLKVLHSFYISCAIETSASAVVLTT